MRISVIGCGYLGAVDAAAMGSLGHDVVGAAAGGRPDRHMTRATTPSAIPAAMSSRPRNMLRMVTAPSWDGP